MQKWMIYGANGYTGELIAREAVRRGEKPILAGRDAGRIEALARELGLEWRAFDLQHADLSGVSLVLHCAGPFAYTSTAMVRACLDEGAHYLDITGEISVFESVLAQDGEARRKGVVLIPGVGFDVVPTDCLAASLHERLPDANELWLAFDTRRGGISRGTMRTMLDTVEQAGAVRRDGKIVRVPHLYDVRTIPYAGGPRLSMTIPWGDVSTAFHTTGIPNIRVYRSTSPKSVQRMRWMRHLLPLLRLRPLKRAMQSMAAKRPNPSEQQRAAAKVELWGRVANVRGEEVTMTSTVAEGYTFTVLSALAAVKGVLADPKPGAFTPAKYFGAGFASSVR
jgi:short subunit dehydrogenase-like uncharacterized protein